MIWSILALSAALALLVYLTHNPRKNVPLEPTKGRPKTSSGPIEVKQPTWQAKGGGPRR
jgi:hypothetical protein